MFQSVFWLHARRMLTLLCLLCGLANAQSNPSISVSPNPAQVNQIVTATYEGFPANVGAIDWGDGASDPVTGYSGAKTHRYQQAGQYVVQLQTNATTLARTTLSVQQATSCTLSADPNPATPGQKVGFTIQFSGPASSKYGLDFGDGAHDNFGSPQGGAALSHSYAQAGVYQAVVSDLANGQPLCRMSVNVQLPTPTLSLDPSNASVNQGVTASLGNLQPGVSYTLDWGDGTTIPASGNGSASLQHTYKAPGVYVVKLSSPGAPPATASVTVRASAPTLSLDPNPASVGQTVTATAGNLQAGVAYLLDWGDGITQNVSGSGTATFQRVFKAPGVYLVRLTTAGAPPATASLTVQALPASLNVEPNPAEVHQTVTASLSGLTPQVTYSLDWGDGSSAPVPAGTQASLSHRYTQAGVYLLRLTTPNLAPVTASLTVRSQPISLSLAPNPAEVNQTVTASLGSLTAGVGYTLDWGDGTQVSASGSSAQHRYSAPGVYLVRLSAPGTAPATASLTVRLPAMSLSVDPNPARVGESVTATPSGLVPGVAYSLDWGDGTSTPITGALQHRYGAAGVYLLKLSTPGAAPATATLRVEAGLDVQDLRLRFTLPAEEASLTVTQGQRVDAALELSYSGQGSVQGHVTLDGVTIAQVSLLARPGGGTVSFPIPQLPTDKTGTRVLAYLPDPAPGETPVPSTPATLSYRVKAAPTELQIAGFVFQITHLSSADEQDFGGTATHSLIVGGVQAFQNVQVSFSHLKVQDISDTRVKVTDGGFGMDLSSFRTTPLPAGLSGFSLVPNRVDFTPDKAQFSGQVALAITCTPPDPSKELAGLDIPRYAAQHPFIGDLVENGANQQYGVNQQLGATQQQLGIAQGLINGGAVPVIIQQPAQIRGQSLMHAYGRTLQFVQAGPNPAGGLGHSADPRFQLGASAAGRVSASMLTQATKYCRPDPDYSYPVSGELKPDSGDLYATGSARLDSLTVPTTPVSLSGDTTLTLDLSAAQSSSHIADVLSAYALTPGTPAPPQDGSWMGVVLERAIPNLSPQRPQAGVGARTAQLSPAQAAGAFTVSNALTNHPVTVTVRAGFTFQDSLTGGSFTDRGWEFLLKSLELAVVENTLVQGEGSASALVPLFSERADVTITTQNGDLQYALAGPLTHNFGASSLSAGGGAWVERGNSLDLKLTGAAWDLKRLSQLKEGGTSGGSSSLGTRFLGNVPAGVGGMSAAITVSSQLSSNASGLASKVLQTGNVVLGAPGNQPNGSTSGGPIRISAPQVGKQLGLSGASYQDGVASLPTLIFSADGGVSFAASMIKSAAGNTTADGLSRTSLGIPDFQMLGQSFNVHWVVIGRSGNTYALGLDGGQKLSDQLPVVGSTVRYRVLAGRNLDLTVHTDGFSRQMDSNATIKVDANDSTVKLNGSAMWPSLSRTASLTAGGDSASVGLHEVPGGYELDLSGGMDMGQGGSTFSVRADAAFGLTDDPYFYVKASLDSRTPIVSVLTVLNIYGFTGGVAYNMAWPDNATVPQYAQPPRYSHDHRVQIIGGITGAFEDGSELHFKAIFKIDTSRGFELTADGWILTPMGEGVFGDQAPQARILASVTGDGFEMFGCLGPAQVNGLNCADLRPFRLAGVVEITAWTHVSITGDHQYVKIGTYGNPITARLIPLDVSATSYLIFGDAQEDGDLRNNQKGTGLFFGAGFDAHFGIAGSLGKIGWPFSCYPWARASLNYSTDFDAGLQINPVSFTASASFDAGFDIKAGCADRDGPFPDMQSILAWNGKGIGLGLQAHIDGTLHAFDPIRFDGHAALEVDLPIIPTFTVGAHVSF